MRPIGFPDILYLYFGSSGIRADLYFRYFYIRNHSHAWVKKYAVRYKTFYNLYKLHKNREMVHYPERRGFGAMGRR